MPVGIDVSTYEVKISTDGVWYLPFVSDSNLNIITIQKCPNGYTCT